MNRTMKQWLLPLICRWFGHKDFEEVYCVNRPEIGSAAKTNPTDTTWCMILFAPDAGGYIELSSNPELAAHNSCMTVGL